MSGHLGERLAAFLDGEMSAADRAAAQVHIQECAACAHALEELAAVDALARELPVEAPAGYFDALPARVRTRVRAGRKRRIAPLAVWAAAAAAVVMFAVVTPTVLHRAPSAAPSLDMAGPAARAVAPAADSPGADGVPSTVAPPASSAPQAFEPRQAPARLREWDRLAKTVVTATPPPAPAAAPPSFAARPPAPPAAPPAPQRADAAGASMPAEAKAEQALSRVEAEAVPPAEEAGKERDVSAAARGGALADAGYGRAAGRRLRGEERYELLLARRPTTAADARALGKAWESFARDLPADRRADEARVRAIESAAAAWRLGGAPADLAAARAAARAYLDAEIAPQKGRVRALLETLP